MSKVVARMAKMKAGNLTGIGNHNQRKTEKHSNPDIEIERSHLNYDLVNRTENYKTDIENYINENKSTSRAVRKDAVLINEWIVTSDQNFFKDLSADETKEFFETAKDYFSENFGENNIRYAQVHLDETTPHMHMGIVPFDKDNKLSAKRVFDRKTLQKIQDELPKYLQERDFDLNRGEKGSDRKHLSVPEYKKVQKEIKNLEVELSSNQQKLISEKDELSKLVKKTDLKVNRERLKVVKEEKTVEVKTGEKNFLGQDKTKTVQRETGNVILPEKHLDGLIKETENLANTNKKLVRYVETDLVKENTELRKELVKSHDENDELINDYNDLVHRYNDNIHEIETLEEKVKNLTEEIGVIYQQTKSFLKEHTPDLQTFKSLFKSLVRDIKEKAPMGNFERLNKQEQKRERDRGMSR